MSLTLYDIYLFTGLPLIGPDSPYLIDDHAAPKLAPLRYCYPSHRAVVKQYEDSSEDPTEIEHIMFLWVLICQYVFCPISGKPSAEYLPMACSLSTGKVYNLAAMLLGSFYREMNSCVANSPLSKLGGVAWILQVWSAAYFSKFFSFPASAGSLSTILLMQGQLESSATAFVEFLQSGTFDELTPPPRPRVGSFDQSWVVAYPGFRDDSPESVSDTLLTACVHHRFLVVDCLGARSPVASRANVSWSFEFYNPSLFPRQFGLKPIIPHLVLYYPMDILHLDSELGSGRLSKATVELLAAAPSSFLSPIRVYAPEDVNSFTAWWPPRRAVLAPTFDYPSAKDTKASASVGITVTPSLAPVKSKKRKASSAPSRPIQSSRERKYSTRSSSRLVSSFSNTDDDPVDLVSSPPGLGDDDDSSGDEDAGNPQGSPTTEELIDDYSLEERNTGLVPESDPPCIPSVELLFPVWLCFFKHFFHFPHDPHPSGSLLSSCAISTT
ncbi:hypothetical protein F511_13917 [Dorcoceras hygrometricum]|uniref:Aminotransferase-like plant mobile domain-containing protein n=1 Tax=Dorcoceras hygrometricum TaxID=472368 RepID=A0A2Z7B313_9LAMI|nr:hypothetical protein F511_13917 [Dorcoceras hygrometricum]